MTHHRKADEGPRPYIRFSVILCASLLVMYLLSFLQLASATDFFLNLTNFYVALTMVAAMGLVMMVGMRQMFSDRRLNIITATVLVVLLGTGVALARTEAFVGDSGFLRSMIPHHSRAILVCEEAQLTDPEIVALCEQIVRSQQDEIDQMKQILSRY